MSTEEQISDEEYMRRLRAHFVKCAGDGADSAADGCTVSEWREMDAVPEDAADGEMECWTDDGE